MCSICTRESNNSRVDDTYEFHQEGSVDHLKHDITTTVGIIADIERDVDSIS